MNKNYNQQYYESNKDKWEAYHEKARTENREKYLAQKREYNNRPEVKAKKKRDQPKPTS